MKRFVHFKARAVAVGIAALAVVVIVSTAVAGPAGTVKTFTGCLVANDGVIVKVKEGDSPKSACSSGQTLARLSGGDITKISVTGGLTLTNGGESGDAEINLDSKFSLPQGCVDGRIAEWDTASEPDRWICGVDNDTTYSASTGLDLSGANAFGIEPSYRVKNTPDCSSGQFATGFDSDGDIQCGTPGSSPQTFQARQTNFVDGDGIADDGDDHTIVTLPVPAGTYVVTGKGVLLQGDDDVGFRVKDAFGCRLGNLPAEYTAFFGKDNDADEFGFSLAGVVTTTGAALTLQCFATNDLDLISVRYATLVALKVG